MKINIDKVNKIIYKFTAFYYILSLVATIYSVVTLTKTMPFSIQTIFFSILNSIIIIGDWKIEEDWSILFFVLYAIIAIFIIITAIVNLIRSKKGMVIHILLAGVYCLDLLYLLFLIIRNDFTSDNLRFELSFCIFTDVIMIFLIVVGVISKNKYLKSLKISNNTF